MRLFRKRSAPKHRGLSQREQKALQVTPLTSSSASRGKNEVEPEQADLLPQFEDSLTPRASVSDDTLAHEVNRTANSLNPAISSEVKELLAKRNVALLKWRLLDGKAKALAVNTRDKTAALEELKFEQQLESMTSVDGDEDESEVESVASNGALWQLNEDSRRNFELLSHFESKRQAAREELLAIHNSLKVILPLAASEPLRAAFAAEDKLLRTAENHSTSDGEWVDPHEDIFTNVEDLAEAAKAILKEEEPEFKIDSKGDSLFHLE